jgi:hypothetical protein
MNWKDMIQKSYKDSGSTRVFKTWKPISFKTRTEEVNGKKETKTDVVV